MRCYIFKAMFLSLTLGLLAPISSFGWPYSPHPIIPQDASTIAINKGFWYGIYSDADKSYIVKANLTVPNDVILLAFPTNSLTIGSGSGGSAPAPKRIAMFIIPVNDLPIGSSSGEYLPWAGFEFKASTNNFNNASDERVRLQYYVQSPIADSGMNGRYGEYIDKMKLFVCASSDRFDFPYDPRAYQPIYNTIDWYYGLVNVVALVDVSCLIRNPSGDWLNSENESLTWCFLRTGSEVPYEVEPVLGGPLWRPIEPVRWFSTMPEWARGY